MREKLFSWSGDDFTVSDMNTKQGFCKIDGQAISLRDTMRLKDMNGEIICVLKKKLLSLMPQYKIWSPDETKEIAIIQKRLVIGGMLIDVCDPKNSSIVWYSMKSSVVGNQSVIRTRNGAIVGKVSMDMLSGSAFIGANRYGIQLSPGLDAIIMICLCAARDEFIEDARKSK